jgi:hypothetical protein
MLFCSLIILVVGSWNGSVIFLFDLILVCKLLYINIREIFCGKKMISGQRNPWKKHHFKVRPYLLLIMEGCFINHQKGQGA